MWHVISVLPVTTLTLFEMAMVTRFKPTAMIEALSKDDVTVACACSGPARW